MKQPDTLFSIIGGLPVSPTDISGQWLVTSPANPSQNLAKVSYSYSQVDLSVKAAHAGFLNWKRLSPVKRKEILLQALERLIRSQSALASIAATELGRTPTDLNTEFAQLEAWIQEFRHFDFNDSLCDREPRGVVAIVETYVWPFLHATQHVFLSLLAGNTVVLKPSEHASISTTRWAEVVLEDASLASVLFVLMGEKEVGRRLVCHDLIQTVVFTGSFEVGMRVKQDTLSQPAKEILLYLSTKNFTVLQSDYLIEEALPALIEDCFLTSGQHCKNTSVIFVAQSRYDEFCEKFHQAAKTFSIGKPSDDAFAGPLIDAAMLDRYLKFSGISEREGAQILMRGKVLDTPEKGYFVTPTLAVFANLSAEQMKKSVSLQTEILSPHVSIIGYQNVEELVAIVSQMQHGLCASVWGQDMGATQGLANQFAVGQVVFNQSILRTNAAASFQARKKSGNHAYHGLRMIEQLSFLRSNC